MIRVLLAEDHHLVRQSLRTLLERSVGIDVVGEAADGHEAVRLVEELKPDILILDLAMPIMGGMEALGKVRHHRQVKTSCCRCMLTAS